MGGSKLFVLVEGFNMLLEHFGSDSSTFGEKKKGEKVEQRKKKEIINKRSKINQSC